ncbi:MAG: methyltransferase domain-containing protein [Acidobacteria bacterium]|nr:methyltransferase domain-containing protein [Acidobacteriota bacterium]
MRFYRYKDDWVSYLESDFKDKLLSAIRGLSLERLQKFPPPKVEGLPFGNETRVLSRFLSGKSSQLDASAFSTLYRSLLNDELSLLYWAFRQNEYLPTESWRKILDSATIDLWIENKCLLRNGDDKLQCQFSAIAIDGVVFLTDPLKDHGQIWEPFFIVDDDDPANGSEDLRPFYHAYMGLDSLRMIEVMEADSVRGGGRYLDCGPGSGGLLLYFGRRFEQAVGIDISQRAATLSQFNAELNGFDHIKASCDNALELSGKYGRFDLITWNLPFIFMPDEDKDRYIDAFGGELGIGLCLDFIKTLPAIMTESGKACVAALAPITEKNENVLEGRLKRMLGDLKLDCHVRVAQVSVASNKKLWDFHHSFGLAKFESVYLMLKPGNGILTRKEAPFTRRLIDRVRERMYVRKFD